MAQEHNHTKSQKKRNRLADVAELYWVQNNTVETVGRELNISRSTVSRLLTQARKEGVIEFIVHRNPDPVDSLERELRQKYGVQISITECNPKDKDEIRNLAVGRDAALWLQSLIGSNQIIGVTWGATVEAVSSQLKPVSSVSKNTVVQVHGSATTEFSGANHVPRILDRFADAFNAQVRLFPVPALFDSASTRQILWRESSIQEILHLRQNLDIIVTSIGIRETDHPGKIYESVYMSAEDIEILDAENTVGNIASIFYRADGSTDNISINERSTGIPFDELLTIPIRFFVISDPYKAKATHAALKTGIVTHLAVDQETAKALLSL